MKQRTTEDAEYKARLAEVNLAKRAWLAKRAESSLITLNKVLLPDPARLDDPEASRYDAQPFHEFLAEALEEVEKYRIRRLIVEMPPRHGKTQLVSRTFPPFLLGRDPYRSVVVGTYNDEFAGDIGAEVRAIMRSPAYGQVFPGTVLKKGHARTDHMRTEAGGILAFVGRGTATTGRGGDFLLLDDPLKDAEEANSPAIRQKCWDWFTKVLMTRRSTEAAPIVITLTRWHEDDVVGRLTDSSNPHFSEKFAHGTGKDGGWKVFKLPAIAEEDDPVGRAPGEPLWPYVVVGGERVPKFGLEFLESNRDVDPVGFSALYQQRPTPEDGDHFTRDMVVPYRNHELPRLENLRIYVGIDSAVGTKQKHDRSCTIVAGVDPQEDIWILPDIFWKRAKSDVQIEAYLDIVEKLDPLVTWFEGGVIAKAMLPFLKKRMDDRGLWTQVVEQVPIGDKVLRSQAIRGRMAQKKVHFPADAWWFQQALSELLKFPNDTHDDFVDALSHIGLGLRRLMKGRPTVEVPKGPAVGTFGWVKWQSDREKRAVKKLTFFGGM